MKTRFLITGAAGHLGNTLVSLLLERGEHVRAFVLPGDETVLSPEAEIFSGNILDPASMDAFFAADGSERTVLIHCAAVITIASRKNVTAREVNIQGTENVMRLAAERGVDRVIYVSSVHAIPERPAPEVIREVRSFSPSSVRGYYAKTKALAASRVLAAAERGLPVSIVHPSGIIGPGDHFRRNHMAETIRAMGDGRIPIAIDGGYDFVDVRDVAQGILDCADQGEAGECYVLSGRYYTVQEILAEIRTLQGRRVPQLVLPYAMAKAVAPAAERIARFRGTANPLLTPYSVYTLHTNAKFSHEKATEAFGYSVRPLRESLRDMLLEYGLL